MVLLVRYMIYINPRYRIYILCCYRLTFIHIFSITDTNHEKKIQTMLNYVYLAAGSLTAPCQNTRDKMCKKPILVTVDRHSIHT